MNIIKETATVVRVIEDTPCVNRFHLEFSSLSQFQFTAGQFLIVTLPNFLDQKTNQPLKRAYSIASPPEVKDYLELCVKNLKTGGLSEQMAKLQVGDKINIQGPFGGFTLQHKYPKYLFLAGGSGISPLICMTKHLVAQKKGEEILFFFSALTRCDLVYEEELVEMQKEFPALKLVFGLTNEDWSEVLADSPWNKEQGIFTKEILQKHIKDTNYEVYLCGPKGFMDAMKAILFKLGFAKEQISYEDWGVAMKAVSKA